MGKIKVRERFYCMPDKAGNIIFEISTNDARIYRIILFINV